MLQDHGQPAKGQSVSYAMLMLKHNINTCTCSEPVHYFRSIKQYKANDSIMLLFEYNSYFFSFEALICFLFEQRSTRTWMRTLTLRCLKFLVISMGAFNCPIWSSQRNSSPFPPTKAKHSLLTFKKRFGLL